MRLRAPSIWSIARGGVVVSVSLVILITSDSLLDNILTTTPQMERNGKQVSEKKVDAIVASVADPGCRRKMHLHSSPQPTAEDIRSHVA